MPHDSARLRVQLGPNPVATNLLNNWREYCLGVPAPRGEDEEVHPVITWTEV